MAGRPQYDPLQDPGLERFAIAISHGDPPGDAYREIYASGRTISNQAACQGAKKRLSYPSVQKRIAQLRRIDIGLQINTNQPSNQPDKPKSVETVDIKQVADSQKELFDRLLKTVRDGEDSASTAAATRLREWYLDDQDRQQQAADAAQLDPSVIARYFCQYAGRVCDSDDLSGILRALAGSLRVTMDQIADCARPPVVRADAPPLPQTPANIDPIHPTLPDTPPISTPTSIV